MRALMRPIRNSAELRLACLERIDQQVELVEDLLEPELTCLMHHDEQQLVGMLRTRVLQREEGIEARGRNRT